MKKSELQEIIKEALRGYSPQIGRTQGGTSDEFMQILTEIVKREDEKYERRPDTDPLPHEKLHSYSSETTPEGEHEVWAIYFDPKTDTYNKRHRVPEETVFGKNAKIQRGDIGEGEDEKYEGDPEKGNAILDKANPDNVERIIRGEEPMYEAQEPKNTWSKHPYIKDLLNAFIYPDNTVSLQVYGTKGGLPIKQTAAVPLAQFTPEYVEKHTSQKYDIDDKFRQGIQQFVDSVQNANA